MRKIVAAVVGVGLLFSVVAHAEDLTPTSTPTAPLTPEERATRQAALCVESRTIRVTDAQKYTRKWLARVKDVRAYCRIVVVPTGNYQWNRGRITAEKREDLVCPKGPPPGESKESAYSVLAVLQDGLYTDQSPTDDSQASEVDKACVSSDALVGLDTQPGVSDMPALNRLMSWKPPTKK